MSARVTTMDAGRATGRFAALVAALALLVSACSGEVDPLVEAIEVRDLGLDDLVIVVPEPSRELPELVVDPGQRVQFTLVGVSGGASIDVRGTQRRWRVSDERVASIDGNGLLTAREDGAVTVGVSIGDVDASVVGVEVQRATLTSIDRLDGPATIDPCLVERYHAIGTFTAVGSADTSTRVVPDASWSIDGVGEVRTLRHSPEDGMAEDGGVRFSADRQGTVNLTATAGTAPPRREAITVSGALQTLEIVGPASSLTLAPGATLDLEARGVYRFADATVADDAAEVGDERTVTEAVFWRVTPESGVVEVSNREGTRGRITAGSTPDTATVVAICGTVPADEREILVRATTTSTSSSDDENELAFRGANGIGDGGDGGRLTVSRSSGSVQLNVSRGAEYDEDEDVTNLADWRVLSATETSGGVGTTLGTDVAGTVTTGGLQRGLFTPGPTASQAVVEATYQGDSARLTITIVD